MVNAKQDALNAGLKNLMEAARPEMLRRLQVVEKAVATYREGTFDEDARKQGYAQAHKLAGVLGTYGMAKASRISHELELALEPGIKPNIKMMLRWIEEVQSAIQGK